MPMKSKLISWIQLHRNPLRWLDFEAFSLAIGLYVFSIIIGYFRTILIALLISSILAVAFILLSVIKIICFVCKMANWKCDWGVILAAAPILAIGLYYPLWILLSNYSLFLKVILPIMPFFFSLLPPKHSLFQTAYQEFQNSIQTPRGHQIIVSILIIIQLSSMLCASSFLVLAGSSLWINNVFDGISFNIFIFLFMAIAVNIALSQYSRKGWIISSALLVFWLRSFLILRGFVNWGGDDGENIAIIRYLLEGGSEPLIEMDVFTDTSHWRWGSTLTLCFQSFMAFICLICGISPEIAPAALSLALNGVLLFCGALALPRVTLKKESAAQLATSLILLAPSDILWHTRMDPNGFMHVLFFSYLALVIIMPKSLSGSLGFITCTVIFVLTHPTSLALIFPVGIYWISTCLLSTRYTRIKENPKRYIPTAILIVISILLLIYSLQWIDEAIRFFSAERLVDSFENFQFGVFLEESELFGPTGQRYLLFFSFAFLVCMVGLILWKNLSAIISKNMMDLLIIALLLTIELILFDVLINLNLLYLSWRLLGLLPIALMPMVGATLTIVERSSVSPSNSSILSRIRPDGRVTASITITMIILTSTVYGAYPEGSTLSLNCINQEELQLMVKLAEIANPDNSIVISEYPVWRYYIGVLGDWPTRSATYFNPTVNASRVYHTPWGRLRWKAFEDLAYRGKIGLILNMAYLEGIDTFYAIVLNRLSSIKPDDWVNGSPYITDLNTYGEVIYNNSAGYILHLSTSFYRSYELGFHYWTRITLGVNNVNVVPEPSRITISANYSSHFQALRLEKSFSPINISEYSNLRIGYESLHESGVPKIRIFVGENASSLVELEPALNPTLEFTYVEFKIDDLPVSTIPFMRIQIDSGSDIEEWNGPGVYTYIIYYLYFWSWEVPS